MNAPAVSLRSPLPVVGKVALLERFRQARAAGTAADVKQLTATLRAVKRQLATVMGAKGGA